MVVKTGTGIAEVDSGTMIQHGVDDSTIKGELL